MIRTRGWTWETVNEAGDYICTIHLKGIPGWRSERGNADNHTTLDRGTSDKARGNKQG